MMGFQSATGSARNKAWADRTRRGRKGRRVLQDDVGPALKDGVGDVDAPVNYEKEEIGLVERLE